MPRHSPPFPLLPPRQLAEAGNAFWKKTPRELIEAVIPDLENNQFAIMFGPENTGLTNEELKYCHYVSAIPTAGFSSLNLAQAIAIHCYELYFQLIHEPNAFAPNPSIASSFELEGMYEHVEDALLSIDFLQEKSHTYWMTNIRHFLGRLRLTSKEAKIIRGICRQLLWHQGENAIPRRQGESQNKSTERGS